MELNQARAKLREISPEDFKTRIQRCGLSSAREEILYKFIDGDIIDVSYDGIDVWYYAIKTFLPDDYAAMLSTPR